MIRRSAALISGDTGVMHMATGVGTPVVALFGPTVRQFGFFPYQSKRAEVVELSLGAGPAAPTGPTRVPSAITTACSRSPRGRLRRACGRRSHDRLGSRRPPRCWACLPQTGRGTAPRGHLRPLAHGAGGPGPAARPSSGRAGPSAPAPGPGAAALEPHAAAASATGARRGDQPAARRPAGDRGAGAEPARRARAGGRRSRGGRRAGPGRASRARASCGRSVSDAARQRQPAGDAGRAGRRHPGGDPGPGHGHERIPFARPDARRRVPAARTSSILAGDVGSGKSALALGIAIRAARAGVQTLFLSGEMGHERVMERALALEGKASVDDLRQGRVDATTRASVGAAAVRLRDSPLMVRELLGNGFEEVQRGARRRAAPGTGGGGLASAHAAASTRGPARRARRPDGAGAQGARGRAERRGAGALPSSRAIGHVGRTRDPRWTTWVRSGPSSRTPTWCSRSIGRRCIGRAREWRGRPS